MLKLIHPFRSIEQLQLQSSHVHRELVNFFEFDLSPMLPGAVTRSGRSRTRLLVKKGTANVCGQCFQHGHNKANCPTLKQRCVKCQLKGHNWRTCTTPLDEYHRDTLNDNKAMEAE